MTYVEVLIKTKYSCFCNADDEYRKSKRQMQKEIKLLSRKEVAMRKRN